MCVCVGVYVCMSHIYQFGFELCAAENNLELLISLTLPTPKGWDSKHILTFLVYGMLEIESTALDMLGELSNS